MTAIVDHTRTTPVVDAATDRVAAIDHLPLPEAHDLVDVTSPLASAELLRELAASARRSIHTTTGQARVILASDLLDTAAALEEQAAARLADVVEAALHRGPSEADVLRAQLGAVIDDLVARHLNACDYIGEHPITAQRRLEIEADVRSAYGAIALRVGTR